MKWNDKRPEENYVEKILMTGGEEMKKLAKAVEKEVPVDKIDLSTAFELPHWQIVWAGEPTRRIDVRMAYGDLMGIYTKFTKYRWHDLRKNPDDLPKEHHNCYPVDESSFSDNVLVVTDRWHCPIVAYINLSVKLWHNPLTEKTLEDERLGEVIAWREIEPFEVEE